MYWKLYYSLTEYFSNLETLVTKWDAPVKPEWVLVDRKFHDGRTYKLYLKVEGWLRVWLDYYLDGPLEMYFYQTGEHEWTASFLGAGGRVDAGWVDDRIKDQIMGIIDSLIEKGY